MTATCTTEDGVGARSSSESEVIAGLENVVIPFEAGPFTAAFDVVAASFALVVPAFELSASTSDDNAACVGTKLSVVRVVSDPSNSVAGLGTALHVLYSVEVGTVTTDAEDVVIIIVDQLVEISGVKVVISVIML